MVHAVDADTLDIPPDSTPAFLGFNLWCYTYTELLVGDDTTTPAGPSTPGQPSETVLVYPPGYTPPDLAVTGSDIGIIALGGLGLVVIGGAAAFASRRRSKSLAA